MKKKDKFDPVSSMTVPKAEDLLLLLPSNDPIPVGRLYHRSDVLNVALAPDTDLNVHPFWPEKCPSLAPDLNIPPSLAQGLNVPPYFIRDLKVPPSKYTADRRT